MAAGDASSTAMQTQLGALLALMRLSSPSLPVGAFSYSRGLEAAVAAGTVHDEASATDHILGLLEHVVCPVDAALLVRLHRAWTQGDLAAARAWTLRLRALRESAELALEDEHMGLALARLLLARGVAEADLAVQRLAPSYTCMFALAAVRFGIEVEPAVAGFLWAICESQVGAALRLLPLGQTAGQRLLEAAMPVIERCVAVALALEDDQVGSFAPGLALRSAQHEVQYSRLFRS